MTTSSSTFQSTIPSTLLMMTAAQTLTTIASTTSPSNAAGVVLLQRTISSQAVATSTLTTSDPETSSSGGISNGGIAGVVVGVAATIVAGIAIFAFRKSAVLPTQKFRNKLNPPPLVDVPSDSTIGGGSGGNQPLLTAPAAAAAVATGPEVSRTESVASRRPLSFGSNGSSSNYYSRQEIVVMPSPLQSPDRTTMIQNHQQQPQFTNLHDFPEDVISSGPGVHMAMYEDQEPFVYSDSPVVVLNGYAPSLGSSYGQPASNYDHLRPQSPIIPPAVLPFVYNTPNVYQQQQQHLHQLNPIYQSQQQPTVNIDQSYVPLHVTNGMPLGSNYGTRMDD